MTTADKLKPADRDVIREAKAELREGHNRWLRNNKIEDFYGSPIHSWRVDEILAATKPLSGQILDVGCFVGEIAERIEAQGNKTVVGMDCLEAALELTEARGIKTILADIDEAVVPFEDDHFDAAVAADVLTEVYDPDAVVAELARVVRPGGTLVFTVPNLACAGNRALLLTGRSPYNLEVRARRGVGHLRLFTRGDLHRAARGPRPGGAGDQLFGVRVADLAVLAVPSHGRVPLPTVGLQQVAGPAVPDVGRERHRESSPTGSLSSSIVSIAR